MIGDPRVSRAAVNIYLCDADLVIVLQEQVEVKSGKRLRPRAAVQVAFHPGYDVLPCTRQEMWYSPIVVFAVWNQRTRVPAEVRNVWEADLEEWRLVEVAKDRSNQCMMPAGID